MGKKIETIIIRNTIGPKAIHITPTSQVISIINENKKKFTLETLWKVDDMYYQGIAWKKWVTIGFSEIKKS